MFNRLRGLFQPKPTAPESRGVSIAFTRGDELLFDSNTRSGPALNDAILRALGGQAALDPGALSRMVAVSATVFACIERRANTISQVPLYATLADDRLDGTDSPFTFFLRQSPLLLGQMSRSADIWGRVFLRKRRNAEGCPVALEYVNPVNVTEMGQPVVTYYQVYNEQTWTYERVEVEDLILMQSFDSRPNGTGISRVEAAYRLIGLDFGTVTHALAFMTNSARIDGMITFDQEVSVEKMAAAREDWRKNFKGAGNAHKTAVMPNGARWVPIQATPKDLMMGETKKDVRAEIGIIFDVDLGLLGLEGVADALSANSTYSSKEVSLIRNAALPFVRTTVLPALNDQWASRDFRAAYELKADEAKIPALAESNLVKADTATSVRASGLYAHNEARALVGMEEEPNYLKRSPDEPLKLWQAGTITLNLFHEYTMGRRLLPDSLREQGEVVLLGGSLIPVTRIAELANANVDRMKNPIPFSPFGSTPTPPQDVTVTAPETPALADGQRDTGDNLFVGLDLANNVDLVALQRQLRERYPNVTWNAPDDFRVTLFYAPVCDPEKARAFVAALALVDVPELTLRVGSLKSFDSIGEHAIHFRVKENADLRDFQDTVYQLAADCGIEASSYSLPVQWIPHITMGYAPEKTTVYWSSKIAITPRGLLCSHGDTPLITSTPLLAAPDVATERAAASFELAVSFADHAYLKAARRELSAFLVDQGLPNPLWTPESAWRLTLLSFDQWDANRVSRMIRTADYGDVRALDLRSAGYVERGGRIYLALEAAEPIDALRTALALDMESVGMTPIQPTGDGVLLCELHSGETVDLTGAPAASYPLVGANITAYKGATPAYAWMLRGMSRAQETDLERWEKKIRSKGREAAFRSESLPPIVAAFVALGLEDAEADAEDVFEAARAWLRETKRAYEDTRGGFVNALAGLFKQAATEDVTRGKFAAQLRANLRKFGLMAFRDGMNSENYDPESFSAKELAAFRKWQADASERVTAVGVEIFKGGGISEAEAALRADMWANVTLRQIFYEGAALAAADKLKTWHITPGKDSCKTCIGRDGVTLPYSKWKEIGLPGDYDALECRGMFCECHLDDAIAGARSADFEAIRSLIVHVHDGEGEHAH
jgi:HK97 family phage portal protein